MLLWLAATTGARRGELCALRWGSVDLEAAELLVLRHLFQAAGRLVGKDTKTHAARRLALSEDSVALLEEHRRRCAERAEACGVGLSEDAYVFSFDPAGRQPSIRTRSRTGSQDSRSSSASGHGCMICGITRPPS